MATQRLRILNVVSSLGMGGVRSVLLDQLAHLSSERFELGVLTLADDLSEHRALFPPHVDALAASYPTPAAYGVLAYLDDAFALRSAKRHGRNALDAIANFAPDILHFHTHPRELALGVLARRRAPVSLVFTDHLVRIRPTDYSRHVRFLLRLAYRHLYRQYDLISVGEVVAGCNEKAGFIGRSRRHLVIENRVDIGRYRVADVGRTDTPTEIIYVGRVHPVKGVDTLVSAFSQVRPMAPLRLVIVGPDEMNGEMQALAASNRSPLAEVEFLGERTDVPELLSRASIGVLPSLREGKPLALLEQLASGLPVIVSDIPELTSVVSDGQNGLVVPVGDVNALAKALETLARDPSLRTRLGHEARRSAERSVSPDGDVLLTRFYESVSGAAPGGLQA